jgi:hypothetical protein
MHQKCIAINKRFYPREGSGPLEQKDLAGSQEIYSAGHGRFVNHFTRNLKERRKAHEKTARKYYKDKGPYYEKMWPGFVWQRSFS